MKNLLILFTTILIFFSCQQNSSSQNKTIKIQITKTNSPLLDSINQLIEQGYILNQFFISDIDDNGTKEFLLHCTSNKKITCDLLDDNNCYQDELLILKNDLTITQTLPISQPLTNDSDIVRLLIDTNAIVCIQQYFRPTYSSGVSRKQYYSYKDSTFLLDSLYHSVSTRSGFEFYSWEYLFNFNDQSLEYYHHSVDMSSEEMAESSQKEIDTTLTLQLTKPINIDSIFELRHILPNGDEGPWY